MMMWTLRIKLSKCLTLLSIINGISAIRVVSLEVPEKVRNGDDVHLQCLYDLGNNTLYSLKWFFRGSESDREEHEQEFFRYTPREKLKKQYFLIPGIKVDMQKSNGGELIITQTNGNMSGRYKCEISAEGTFQTVAEFKYLNVEANASPPLMDNKLIITIIVLSCISCIVSHCYLSLTISGNSCAAFHQLSPLKKEIIDDNTIIRKRIEMT